MIRTLADLRADRRHEARRLEGAQRILTRMQSGETLHLTYTRHGPRWELSGGGRVDGNIAELVVQSASVVNAGDVLFAGSMSQTYQWWREEA
jgi:hypothetical protein